MRAENTSPNWADWELGSCCSAQSTKKLPRFWAALAISARRRRRGRATGRGLKLRNVIAKLPKRSGLHEQVKAAYWAALDEATDPADAEQRLRELVAELERTYPSAASCLAEDLPALCIHLNYFPRLRKRFRSSNLLERSLEEVKRRTKVIGRFPGETSCLSMC